MAHDRAIAPTILSRWIGTATLTANFSLSTFLVSAVCSPPEGGTITGAGSVPYGSTNVLTVTPNPGYQFERWMEGSDVVGTSVSLTNVIYGNRSFVAVLSELNFFHDVFTATAPPNLATIAGAGRYTNGQAGVFSAPSVVTNGLTRYLFQQFTMNGAFWTTSNEFSRTFTTADPTNISVVAEYTPQNVRPLIIAATANYTNPVRRTSNFVVTLRFDRTMLRSPEPIDHTHAMPSTGRAINVSTGGQWTATVASNDTYVARPVAFTNGMDGEYSVWVSDARAFDNEELERTNVMTVIADVTAPANPAISVIASNRVSVTVGWSEYAAPADLAGFKIYPANL